MHAHVGLWLRWRGSVTKESVWNRCFSVFFSFFSGEESKGTTVGCQTTPALGSHYLSGFDTSEKLLVSLLQG